MDYNEIETNVSKAKLGDSESLTALLLQFKPYIYKIAKSYNIKNFDEYDLMQIGYIALIKSIDKYREGSHSFSSYVYSTIKNEMRYTARSNKKHSNTISINTPIGDNSSSDFSDFLESAENTEIDFIDNEQSAQIKKIISDLEPDEFELIFFVYYNNFSLTSYAIKRGMSYSKVVRKKNFILNKLNKMLAGNI